MTRDAFKDIAREAIEAVTVAAERELSRTLPRRYLLGWLGGPKFVPGDDIAELLTAMVFVSEFVTGRIINLARMEHTGSMAGLGMARGRSDPLN